MSRKNKPPLKPVSPKANFIENEHKWLKYWQENDIVSRYLQKNDLAKKRFSFFDGPITANNPMGVHHAWGRTYKDLFQRYKNMQGFKQRFQNGFDCQGLWIEVEVEKEKGFTSKKDIEKYIDQADVMLTELKAAAVDVATKDALQAGLEVVYCDNIPLVIRDEDDLDPAIIQVVDKAIADHK